MTELPPGPVKPSNARLLARHFADKFRSEEAIKARDLKLSREQIQTNIDRITVARDMAQERTEQAERECHQLREATRRAHVKGRKKQSTTAVRMLRAYKQKQRDVNNCMSQLANFDNMLFGLRNALAVHEQRVQFDIMKEVAEDMMVGLPDVDQFNDLVDDNVELMDETREDMSVYLEALDRFGEEAFGTAEDQDELFAEFEAEDEAEKEDLVIERLSQLEPAPPMPDASFRPPHNPSAPPTALSPPKQFELMPFDPLLDAM